MTEDPTTEAPTTEAPTAVAAANVIALCSMLHEPAGVNSATRRFRDRPVLTWTMRRLAMSERLARVIVLAWDDQLDALADIDVVARPCGVRRALPQLAAVAAAQRWADGWRGGLLGTCWFDDGFVPGIARQACADEGADAVVLVSPAAGLVDPRIIDDLIAASAGPRDFYFTQAAPGLGGVLVKAGLLEKFAAGSVTPGKLVHYLPDAPALDPVTSDACVAVPLDVSRGADRFTLDSRRQVDRLERATASLNGTLVTSHAAAVVGRVAAAGGADRFPRDVVLELTPRRRTRPTFAAATHFTVDRPDASPAVIDAVLRDLGGQDGVRVTLAGVGDPLLHDDVAAIIERLSAVAAVSVETDLVDVPDATLRAIAAGGVDVLAVHVPAVSPATYAAVMGVDAMAGVVGSIRTLLEYRRAAGRGTPVVAPVFTKLPANFDEMEAWYDTWLRAIGSAVIRGPSTFGGQTASGAVADMTPGVRRPCERLRDRVTILSDGRVVTCEEDPTGRQALGSVPGDRLETLWNGPAEVLRGRHRAGVGLPVLCQQCSEWHRP